MGKMKLIRGGLIIIASVGLLTTDNATAMGLKLSRRQHHQRSHARNSGITLQLPQLGSRSTRGDDYWEQSVVKDIKEEEDYFNNLAVSKAEWKKAKANVSKVNQFDGLVHNKDGKLFAPANHMREVKPPSDYEDVL